MIKHFKYALVTVLSIGLPAFADDNHDHASSGGDKCDHQVERNLREANGADKDRRDRESRERQTSAQKEAATKAGGR